MKKSVKIVLLLLITWVLSGLQLQSWSPLRYSSLDSAKNYEGIREAGKNRGQEIDRFVKRGNGKPGWPWCAYFGYYCVDQAAIALSVKNPLYKTGSCALMLKAANNNFSKVTIIPVASNNFYVSCIPGDILIFKSGRFKNSDINKLWPGHFAFVVKRIDKKRVLTIEGNTNKAGSREGDGVYVKTRNLYSKKFPVVAIIRICDNEL